MAKKIILDAPHEHAGREYPAGAKLTLDDDQADWLIGLGKAHEPPGETPKAEAKPAKGGK
jgi:hypothetical protein